MSSTNALFVVRMVLNGLRTTLPQRISAVAATHIRARASSSSATSPDFSFLEDEDQVEYERITSKLPHREVTNKPLPWPTLLKPHEERLPCEPLARLAAERDPGAKQMLEQLQSMGYKPVERVVYLQPAIKALEERSMDEFMAWMEIYPSDAAVKADPMVILEKRTEVFQTLRPIIKLFRARYMDNDDDLSRFLDLCARKGWIVSVLEHFIADTGSFLTAENSINMVLKASKSFQKYCSPSVPIDQVEDRMNKWVNKVVRRLVITGHIEQAAEMAQSLGYLPYLRWQEPTLRMLNDEGNAEQIREARRNSRPKLLVQRIRRALEVGAKPKHLADILRELDDRPQLLKRFEEHIIMRPGQRSRLNRGRVAVIHPTRGERLLHQAQIIKLQRQKRYVESIEYFLERYRPTGLPDHPFIEPIEPISPNLDPKAASIHMITTLIPSLLSTLPSPFSISIPAYHREYLRLSKDFHPSLRPRAATHSVFIRMIVRLCGAKKGYWALRAIARAGYDPGQMSFTWILLGNAREQNFGQVQSFLEKMRKGDTFSGSIRYPKPSAKTDAKVLEILESKSRVYGHIPESNIGGDIDIEPLRENG